MRRTIIAAAGLAWVAGCAGNTSEPLEPMPLAQETFVDTEDPGVKACLTVVSLHTNSAGLGVIGLSPVPQGTILTVDAAGDRWQCRFDADNRVTGLAPL